MPLMANAKWKVGDRVFDMPSQKDRTILKVTPDTSDPGAYLYLVDAEPNVTGDGAFPDGWRNEFEIGPAGIPMPLVY